MDDPTTQSVEDWRSHAERGNEFGTHGNEGKKRRGAFWPMLALLILAAAVLISLQSRRPQPINEWIGRALPPLEVGGWLNTDRPLATEDLRGKVVLVDFWATWCGPCLHHMPALVEFHERFANQGVTIVGLTTEPSDAAPSIERVVERMGMKWPIAYDARAAYSALGIRGMPTYVLYDRTGRSVWGGHSLAGLEDATVAALAR